MHSTRIPLLARSLGPVLLVVCSSWFPFGEFSRAPYRRSWCDIIELYNVVQGSREMDRRAWAMFARKGRSLGGCAFAKNKLARLI
ncbi:hypothetical protein GGR58DRAFT_471689 [Xylaria digitata]|nr:hypothetical protein GGR58DRAFT_471689 [Xylaria digitata]